MLKPDKYHPEVSAIWLNYYQDLTGKDGSPSYDEKGSLLSWIAEHSPDAQTDLLHIIYEAAFADGVRQTAHILKIMEDAA